MRGSGRTVKGSDKISFRKRGRNLNSNHLILECPESIRKISLNRGRIFCGFKSFFINDFDDVGYGHMAKSCNKKEVCGNWGREGHNRRLRNVS